MGRSNPSAPSAPLGAALRDLFKPPYGLLGHGVSLLLMTVALLALPPLHAWFDGAALQYGVNLVLACLGTLFVAGVAGRRGQIEMRVMALSLLLGLVVGLYELMEYGALGLGERGVLWPFALLMVGASFLYGLRRRYLVARQQVARLNADLAERLLQQSSALQVQHERVRETERQQSLLVERQRLMQDMHDGLGSALLSAMVAVEQGSMEQHQVVEVLRECVDDLRLVIDSLEPVGHDLVSLLATMRYRLGKRLQAGGLTLEWDVQDLPPLTWLEPPDALHVLRLMQEALSNVLKHARATRVRMVTRHHNSYVEIRVEDDGDGFDVGNAPRGRGLKSQQRRAQRLGGSLRIDSSPGHGTRLSLRLPVLRRAALPGPDKPVAD